MSKTGEASKRTTIWQQALPANEIEGHARRYKDARTSAISTQPKKVLADVLDKSLIAYLMASLG